MRLAKAELAERVSAGVQAGVWMAAAGVIGLIAFFLVIQAIVFGIASLGLAMHWACLIVAVVLAIIAAALFFYGRSNARETMRPSRAIEQIEKDMHTVRSN
jgi:membrane protein implicated in regulation of membrane protease activity